MSMCGTDPHPDPHPRTHDPTQTNPSKETKPTTSLPLISAAYWFKDGGHRFRWLGFASQARTLRYACAIPIFPLNTKKHQST